MPAWCRMSTKALEVVGRAEATGRREVADGLIAPRGVQRVLADRQQLDVGVAHHLAVLGQLRGQIAVVQEAVGFGRRASMSRDGPRRR